MALEALSSLEDLPLSTLSLCDAAIAALASAASRALCASDLTRPDGFEAACCSCCPCCSCCSAATWLGLGTGFSLGIGSGLELLGGHPLVRVGELLLDVLVLLVDGLSGRYGEIWRRCREM